MPQRYNLTDPTAGANLYQTYLGPGATPVGYPTVPSPLIEIGWTPGEKFLGNLNCQWMFTQMAAGSASVAAGGTIYVNPGATPPFSGQNVSVAGGITGTVLVGDAIHVFVDDGTRRLKEIQARLDADRVEYVELAQVPPTIGDLFVTATSGEREAA